MTPCQHRLLRYVEDHIAQHSSSPSYSEIRKHLGIGSNSGVHRVVRALADGGYLRYVPHKARSLQVIRSADGGSAYPVIMTEALRDVLGMPNYKAHQIWMALREVGQIIPARYEDEMAAALHFLIPIAIEHGDGWQPAAARKLLTMQAEHNARVANDA